jgi:hypothetical protein
VLYQIGSLYVTNDSSILNTIMVADGCIAVALSFLQAGRARATLSGTEESMTAVDFITALLDYGNDSCVIHT